MDLLLELGSRGHRMGTAGACNPPHKAVTRHSALCRECMDLLLELGAPVEYIILTTHAYEHKVFVPSFQRRFPQAQVYYSPKCAPSPPDTLCSVGRALTLASSLHALYEHHRYMRRVSGLHSWAANLLCVHLATCLSSGQWPVLPQSVTEGHTAGLSGAMMLAADQ